MIVVSIHAGEQQNSADQNETDLRCNMPLQAMLPVISQ
jgi:hypothetical protein